MELYFKKITKDTVKAKEKKLLIDSFRKLYKNIYGNDLVDSFLCFTKFKFKFRKAKKEKILKNYSSNYNKIINNLFSNTKNNELIGVFCKNKLIGAFRIVKINKKIGKIPDITFWNLKKINKEKVFVKSVEYIISYFQDLGYQKLYLEIPFNEPILLIKINALDFGEDPDDIDINSERKTYVLNKVLG